MTGGYGAAQGGAALLERDPRAFLVVSGRAVGEMLTGIMTNSLPPALVRSGGIRTGFAPYAAILTPKGRLVTDLRVHRLGDGSGSMLLDLPAIGLDGALAHFGKYLPPRLARAGPPGTALGTITVVGSAAARALTRTTGLVGRESELGEATEGDVWITGGEPDGAIRVVRSGDVIPPAFDIVGPAAHVRELARMLRQAGADDGGAGLWHLLRLEKGRPAFGFELDTKTMPAEAGIEKRCIDFAKGCFTGQEVVVRIRDRGHVNRSLRGLLLGDAPLPARGTRLFAPGRERSAGTVASTAVSPLFGQGIGLAFVRREVEPPATVFLGAHGGPRARVRALSAVGWVTPKDDPGAAR